MTNGKASSIHSQVITIRGDSYRLREKRRAGLIKTAQLHQEQLT